MKIIEIIGKLPIWKNFTAMLGKNLQSVTFVMSTSTMRYHLVQVFKVRLPVSEDQSKKPPVEKTKQSTITAFVKKQSVEEFMAKMTAKDGFTIHAIANSSFICKLLTLQGLQAPHDSKTVAKLVLKFANDKKHDMAKEIKPMIECGKWFSASHDEYTSIKTRRLASMNFHSKNKNYSLG